MCDRCGLDFCGSHSLSSDLERVVRAATDVPEPAVVNLGPIAVNPYVGETCPVGVKIALGISPKAASHADPRLANNQFTHSAPDWISFFIYYVRVHPRNWTRE